MLIAIQALVVVAFVAVHVFAGKLHWLSPTPRSQWLSLAGGVAVAYVFVYIFPQLATAQTRIVEGQLLMALEHHIYLIALSGLVVFYGLERMVKTAPQRREKQLDTGQQTRVELHIFWLHMAIFAVYNALIGYLLVHREGQDAVRILVYGGSMALHFLVNDYALEQHHHTSYQHRGRWLLAAASVVGWIIGLSTQLHQVASDLLFAFLAGGIVLNVLKEELPEERRSRFIPFVTGTVVYALLLLLL